MSDSCELLCLDLERAEHLRAERLAIALGTAAAERAKALADPTRLTIAAALVEGDELCVCDLAWVVERAQNLVSHHVRAMRSAGVLSSRRDGKMVMYRLTPAGAALTQAVLAAEAVR